MVGATGQLVVEGTVRSGKVMAKMFNADPQRTAHLADQLGAVVPVTAGLPHRQRDPATVGDQVVFRSSAIPIDR